MRKIPLLAATIFGGILAIMLQAAPAQAQATRTWVSGVGDDANPCSRTAPCKTFAGAISKTAAGGEINVLDPGGFGAVTITKSISITSAGFEAGVLVSGTNGIIVNAASTDKVLLEGLDIEGLGTGLNGVQIVGGGKVTINKCSIRNFTGNGVNVVGAANLRVVVKDSLILNNAGGVNIQGASSATNTGIVLNTTIDNNPAFGVQVAASNNLIIGNSTILGTATGVNAIAGSTFTSLSGNATNATFTPGTTIPLK